MTGIDTILLFLIISPEFSPRSDHEHNKSDPIRTARVIYTNDFNLKTTLSEPYKLYIFILSFISMIE